MSNTPAITAVSRSDRYGFVITIVFGIGAAVALLVLLIQRIVSIAPNVDVPVVAPFGNEMASLPIGPNGAEVAVEVDSAIIQVTGMPPITLVSLILTDAIPTITTITIIVLACFIIRHLIAGSVFSKQNIRIVNALIPVAVIGWASGALFRTMGINGAFATLSDRSYNNVLAVLQPEPALALLGLGVVVYAFQIGARLQRETEGLV